MTASLELAAQNSNNNRVQSFLEPLKMNSIASISMRESLRQHPYYMHCTTDVGSYRGSGNQGISLNVAMLRNLAPGKRLLELHRSAVDGW